MAEADRTWAQGACCLIAATACLFVACGGGGNVNAPRGNAIGDRHADFMRVVAQARTLPPGAHPSSTLPPDLRIKNLLTVYVGPWEGVRAGVPVRPARPKPDLRVHRRRRAGRRGGG